MDLKMDLKKIAEPLYRARGWMKFLGVLEILTGVVMALSIFGLVYAWLPVWLGVLMLQAAGKANLAYVEEDEAQLIAALGKIKLFFDLKGV